MAAHQVALPLITGRTRQGPLLFHSGEGVLRICWDYETDEGDTQWAMIEFSGVSSLEWRAPVAMNDDASRPSSYSSMTVSTGTPETAAAESRAEVVPFTHAQRPLRLQEFRLWFDDGGTVRLIAETWTARKGGPEVVATAAFVA